MLSRSERVKQLVSTMPVSAGIVRSYVPGETTESVVDATEVLAEQGIRSTLDFLGEDTLDTEQADATVAAYLDVLQQLVDPRADPDGRGVGEAVRDRPGAARPGSQDRAGERTHDLPGRPQRGHHGHPRHGGPHHHRLDAGDPARPAQGLPGDRCGAPGLPAPHRVRLPRARLRGVAGAPVQGRLQRAGGGGLPVRARRGPVLRPMPQGAAGRAGLPDDRHPRPAADRDRVITREPLRARAGLLRVPDALRHPSRGAAPPGQGR